MTTLRTALLRALLALGCLAPCAHAAAPRVEVTYVAPDSFADVRDAYTSTPPARDYYLAEIRRYIEQHAARRMADGETLEVTITNVDMAGDYQARRPQTTDIRMVLDVYPARLDLRFRLSREDGSTISQADRVLRSTAYPAGVGSPYSVDPLRYEKALIDSWLSEDLPWPRQGSGG